MTHFQVDYRIKRRIGAQESRERNNPNVRPRYIGTKTGKHLPFVFVPSSGFRNALSLQRLEIGYRYRLRSTLVAAKAEYDATVVKRLNV